MDSLYINSLYYFPDPITLHPSSFLSFFPVLTLSPAALYPSIFFFPSLFVYSFSFSCLLIFACLYVNHHFLIPQFRGFSPPCFVSPLPSSAFLSCVNSGGVFPVLAVTFMLSGIARRRLRVLR